MQIAPVCISGPCFVYKVIETFLLLPKRLQNVASFRKKKMKTVGHLKFVEVRNGKFLLQVTGHRSQLQVTVIIVYKQAKQGLLAVTPY